MRYPNFDGKYAERSLIEPERYLAYQRARGQMPTRPPPEGVILCYTQKLLAHVRAHHEVEPCDGFLPRLLYLVESGRRIAVMGGFGIGAPAAAVILEGLIAFGIRRFISIGTAGTLQPDIAIGDLVVCERAIRDEGTSHHYLPPDRYALPSASLTAALASALERAGRPHRLGTSWTTDAPYRETHAEAAFYQAEGVAAVEMEAAALFSVAAYRGAEMAAVFTISDSLADLEWRPEFHSEETVRGLETIHAAALETLLAPGS
jgi:uridine phosphorylase